MPRTSSRVPETLANPVGRYPLGLLGWLDSKAQGTTPHDLDKVLSGIVDVGQLYHQQPRQIVSGVSGAVASVGFWAGIQVPDDEIWFVHGVASQITGNPGVVPAGTTVQISTAYNVKTLGQMVFTDAAPAVFAAGAAAYSGRQLNMWAPPATLFYSFLHALTGAGAFTLTTRVDCSAYKA